MKYDKLVQDLTAKRDRLNQLITLLKAEASDVTEIKEVEKKKKWHGRRHYNGSHWTQTPEGKARMSEVQKMRNTRKEASKLIAERANDVFDSH